MCGHMKPGLPSRGLNEAHIVSGVNDEGNSLFLCKNCSDAFDLILKPAIYRALTRHNNGKVPEDWETAEGRAEGSGEDNA